MTSAALICQDTNYLAVARERYERALSLMPTEGFPYNQLAVLHLHEKEYFAAGEAPVAQEKVCWSLNLRAS